MPAAAKKVNAYQVFLDSLTNPHTRKNYLLHFREFQKAMKASESCNELLEMDGSELENHIVQYIKELVKRGAATGSIRLKVASIQKFFVENRQESKANWRWLKARIPKGNGRVKDRNYTKDELVKLWNQSDVRKKAIISLLMAGIRKGAFPSLRVGNLTKISEYLDREGKQHKIETYHLYRSQVYEGDPEEYITFTTPSGAKAIDQDLEARRVAGEEITPNSPLIRDAFNALNADKPKPVTCTCLDMLFGRFMRAAGIRPKEKKGSYNRQDRHPTMLFHSFRKYYNHQLLNSGVNLVAKEIMMGHQAPGLEKSYLCPLESELLTEFVKAIPALTLSEEVELKQQVTKLQAGNADIEMLRVSFYQQQKLIMHLNQKIEAMDAASRRAGENREIVDEKLSS
jgi:hypothetical protein